MFENLPDLIPIRRVKQFDPAAPCIVVLYELLNAGKIRAYKEGRNTLLDGKSYAAYRSSLPAYKPGAAS